MVVYDENGFVEIKAFPYRLAILPISIFCFLAFLFLKNRSRSKIDTRGLFGFSNSV